MEILSKVFPFPVNETLKSRNEIINYVNEHFFNKTVTMPLPKDIFSAAAEIWEMEIKLKYHQAATGILAL